MNISAWSIRNPIPAIVLFVVLMVLGLFSFTQLPITRFPNIDIPIVQVQVRQPGAAPAELEAQVTKKIEDSVSGIAGVKRVISTVSDGLSQTTIEFRIEVNTDRALNDVKDAIAKIRADLPRGIEEPIVSRLDVVGLPIVTYAVSANDRTIEELSWFVDDVIARRLQSIRGVSSAPRIGGVDREVLVELDTDRLLALGVTAGDVSRQLRATNIDLAGGRGEVGGREQSIRTLAGARTIDELAATRINLPGGRQVVLSELGRISDTAAEQRRFARHDGRPVIGFAVTRAVGASDAVVAQLLDRKIADIKKEFPNIRIEKIDSNVSYTVGNYDSAMTTLIEGALLAVLVVFLFLRDWRATIIASLALPLSIIPTFFVIHSLGFSLNLVSLLAITLATGVLVDDAIVEIENIVRHMRMGKSAWRASLEAADEIGLAVIAISLTIMAVFAPVSFMGGIAGQYFKQFGLTVAISVFFSLLVARLVTPLLGAYFLRAKPHAAAEHEGPVLRSYVALVRWSVRHRFITMIAGIGVLAASIAASGLLPKGFVPRADEARLLLGLELPPGSRLEDTMRVTDDVARLLRARPEVASVFVDGGKVGLGAPEVRVAQIVVNLTHKSKRSKTQIDLEREINVELRAIPDIRFWFLNDNGQRGLSLVVAGVDSATVERTAAEIASQMKRIPIISNVVSTAALDRPEIRIDPNSDRAAELGVTTEAIADAIRIATIGDIDANLAKYNAGDRLVPIRVRLQNNARESMELLENVRVLTKTGASVPLTAVADIRFGQGPTSISRFDRVRRVALEADLTGTDALGEALEMIYALPAVKNMPAGVSLQESGDAEIMGEVFASFAQAMGAGILMVLAVLVLLFGSVMQPITILLSLPLSIGGVIFALFLTDRPVSMPVVIGILMLLGIVTKNAILLIDFAIESMAKGMNRLDAVVDAGRKRARPIVMTTIAMAAGMLPSALGLGDGGEFRSPMAIAVIGGLIASTMLSLVFVPAFFTLMDDVGRFFSWLFAKTLGPTDEEPAGASPVTATAAPSASPLAGPLAGPLDKPAAKLPLAAE